MGMGGRMRLSRLAALCLATIGLAVAVVAHAGSAESPMVVESAGIASPTNATVVNVIDGDTVVVVHDDAGAGVGGEVVRLLGVDAPERGECGWGAATAYLEDRLLGADVRLDVGMESHDRYDRLLAGVFLAGELVDADLASQGLGRPMLVQPGDRFRDAVAAAWVGPAAAAARSCEVEADLRQPTAAAALAQNAGLGLDVGVRLSAHIAWREYVAARQAELTRAVDALVPADDAGVLTADDLLDDPATASVADFDDADTIKQQVRAVQAEHDSLMEGAARLRGAVQEPSHQGATDLGDEGWSALGPRERAEVDRQIRGLTERSEAAVKDARSTLRQYRKLVASAKARAAAKARARAKARAAAEARAHPVRVATYNICKSTCGTGKHSWAKRRKALVNEVRRADPDVLAVQEANTATWRGTRQIDDVRRMFRPAGYEIASTRYTCATGCTRGAHIFYKPDRMSLSSLPDKHMASAGMASLATIAGKKFGKIQDRAVSWAFLTPRGSSRPTLYVSVHLVTQQTKQGERLRVATARNLDSFTRQLVARAGLRNPPIVVAGDFNSFARRQPHGAQAIMTASGFKDGYTAPVKENADIGTVNITPKTAKYQGFPPKPYRYQGSPTRIDYVFSTVDPLRHEVVVRLTKTGRFDDRYRASDHNMVLVDLPLR